MYPIIQKTLTFKLSVAVVCLSILSACSSDSNDGVPTVSDYCNVVVNGKQMTNIEFMDKYCVGKTTNETCLSVMNAERIKSLGHRGCP